jgi:hypothetical protein
MVLYVRFVGLNIMLYRETKVSVQQMEGESIRTDWFSRVQQLIL